jgi:CrcB protein
VTPAPAPRLLVAVAVGGALGAVARWGLGEAFGEASGFPWTTFGINVAGSFVLALLPAVAAVRRSRVLALGLGPGLLGGFTTLSTYAEQSRALLADGHDLLAASYVLGTLAVCLAAVAVAHRLSSPLAQREFEDEEGNE